MMNKRVLVLLALSVLVCSSLFAAYGSYDLDLARRAMDRSDYRGALDQYRAIATGYGTPDMIVKEACFFVGFCYVKLGDPWSAINAFESFLNRFRDYSGDTSFIPDAMYNLGRTYEEVGRRDRAVDMYRLCVQRYPYSEFTGKSQDRLRMLGDNGGGGNYPPAPYPGGYGVSREVQDMIELAKSSPNSYSRDEMLLAATKRATNGADFAAISRACSNQYTQGQIIEKAKGHRAMVIAEDYVDLAKTTSSYYRDDLLLYAANKIARTAQDFRILTDACSNSFTKTQILDIARRVLGQGSIFGVSFMVQKPADKKSSKGVKKAKAVFDSFDGMTIKYDQIARVNWFLDAVRSGKNIKETSSLLTKEDRSLEGVRDALKKVASMDTFEKLHK